MLLKEDQTLTVYPGRVSDYKEDTTEKLRPYSCVMRRLPKDVGDFVEFISTITKDLCGGAGVKINIDEFPQLLENLKKLRVNSESEKKSKLSLYIPPTHPDYPYLLPRHKNHLDESPNLRSLISVNDSLFEGGLISVLQLICLKYTFDFNIVLDLSKIRPNGTVNSQGMIASGLADPRMRDDVYTFCDVYLSFFEILNYPTLESIIKFLGVFNDCLKRGGGKYGGKKGIITTSFTAGLPGTLEYLNLDNNLIPGGHKKSYRIIDFANNKTVEEFLPEIAEDCNSGGSFFEFVDRGEENLFHNVCVGIKLPNNDTCLINRIPLYLVDNPYDIINMFANTAYDITELHYTWRDGKDITDILPLNLCDQVAIDFMGLASMLAKFKVGYVEFTNSINAALKLPQEELELYKFLNDAESISDKLAIAFCLGVIGATRVCDSASKKYGFKKLARVFCFEPGQNHVKKCKYILEPYGKLTSSQSVYPAIHKLMKRNSNYEDVVILELHPDVETIFELGNEAWLDFTEAFLKLLNLTGRGHGCGSVDYFNLDNNPITVDVMRDFHKRGINTKYYTQHMDWLNVSNYSKNLESKKFIEGLTNMEDLVFKLEETDKEEHCHTCGG